MSTPRGEIDYQSMDELEDAYKQIHAMPNSANKQKMLQAVRNVHAKMLEMADQPVLPIAPDAHLLGIVDHGSGMLRTAGGEIALGGKALYDKATTGKTDWNSSEAIDRITDAIVPMGDPARGGGEYLERFGAPEMGHFSDTWPGQKMGVERGSRWDITGRGALGFGIDMAATPGNVKSVVNGFENRALKKAAADMGPMTAKQLQEGLEKMQAAAKLKEQAGFFPSVARTTEGGKTSLTFNPGHALDFAQRAWTDPVKELGDLLVDMRMSNPDKAAKQAGKKLPSQIWREHGMPGYTSDGIRDGMRGIIDRTEDSIDQMNTPAEGLFVPKRQQSQFLTPILPAHLNRRAQLPGSSIAVEAADNDVLKQFEHAARQDPGVIRAAEDAHAGAGRVSTTPDHSADFVYDTPPRQLELPGVPKVTSNSGMQSVERTVPRPRLKRIEVEPAVPPRRVMRAREDGSPYYEDIPGKPAVYKDVAVMEDSIERQMEYVDRPPTVEPGRTIVQTEGTPSVNPPAPKTALQTLDRPFSWLDARSIRREFQKKAAAAGRYLRRDPLEPGPQSILDETSARHHQVADRAGELELEMLDEAKTGLGGDVWNKHRDVSGLLTGAPYLDREFTGGGVTRAATGTKRGFAPTDSRLWDLLDSAKGVALAGGGKALSSPWASKGAAPAARAMWLNDYWNREYSESDNNPYGMIKKYGVKK